MQYLPFNLILSQTTTQGQLTHSRKTNDPSILFSMDCRRGNLRENTSLKLEAGAGLNSYGPFLGPQTCNKHNFVALYVAVYSNLASSFIVKSSCGEMCRG